MSVAGETGVPIWCERVLEGRRGLTAVAHLPLTPPPARPDLVVGVRRGVVGSALHAVPTTHIRTPLRVCWGKCREGGWMGT